MSCAPWSPCCIGMLCCLTKDLCSGMNSEGWLVPENVSRKILIDDNDKRVIYSYRTEVLIVRMEQKTHSF